MIPSPEEIARLNALPKRPNARGLLRATVIRVASPNRFLLMSGPGDWLEATILDSSARLDWLVAGWDIRITGTGADDASEFLEVVPMTTAPTAVAQPSLSAAAFGALETYLETLMQEDRGRHRAAKQGSTDRYYFGGRKDGLALAIQALQRLQEAP